MPVAFQASPDPPSECPPSRHCNSGDERRAEHRVDALELGDAGGFVKHGRRVVGRAVIPRRGRVPGTPS